MLDLKSRADTLKDYNLDLEASIKWRKAEQYDKLWRSLIDLYRGKHFTEADLSHEDKIMVNIAFATKNVIAPAVSINHPVFSVLARREDEAPAAELVEQGLNFWWHRYRFHPEVRRAVDDWIILGHGWVKVGWKYEQGEEPVSDEERDQMLQEQMGQVEEFLGNNPEFEDETPDIEDVAEGLPATKRVTKTDDPFVERVSPFDVFVDPEATCPADMRWIAQRIVMPLAIARANPAYKTSVRRKLEGDSSLNPRWRDEETGSGSRKVEDSQKRVTVYEFYDLLNGKFSVFCKDAEEFLVDPVALPYVYGNPFVMLRNYDVPDFFYPVGDLEMIAPIQAELNEVRSDMMNHRKRYARAYVARANALSTEARNTLEADYDNRIVYVDDDNTPLSDIIQPIPITMVDGQMYGYSNTIENDIDSVSAVSEYQRGGEAETRRTATEAAMIQDAVNARSQDKLSTLEVWLSDVAEHVLKLFQEYMTGETMIRIVGESGFSWVPFDRQQIQGEFDFMVEAGSTQPRNESQRRQQALMLANVMQPYLGQVVDPAEMARYVLKEGFGIKNPERFLVPPAPMMGVPPEGGEVGPDGGLALPMSGPNMPPDALLASQQAAGQ
jgi:hypothetical protein